jgi:hypothetical protein
MEWGGIMQEKPITVGDLKEIIKGLKDNTRIIVLYETVFNDNPKIYVTNKSGCKYKKELIIEG